MGSQIAAHWWVILIIVVLLFGAPKLPQLARSLGQSMKIFRSEIKSDESDKSATTESAAGDTATKP